MRARRRKGCVSAASPHGGQCGGVPCRGASRARGGRRISSSSDDDDRRSVFALRCRAPRLRRVCSELATRISETCVGAMRGSGHSDPQHAAAPSGRALWERSRPDGGDRRASIGLPYGSNRARAHARPGQLWGVCGRCSFAASPPSTKHVCVLTCQHADVVECMRMCVRCMTPWPADLAERLPARSSPSELVCCVGSEGGIRT